MDGKIETPEQMKTLRIDEAPQRAARPPVVFEQKGGLVPTTFDEAFRMAGAFAGSGMVPKAYEGKPEAVFVAMQMGAELGIPPLQAVQNIAVINGKPGVYGDMGKALLLAAGCVIDEDDTLTIQKNSRARCKITRPGRPPTERTFSVEDAQTAGLWKKQGPWTTYPWRQMAWRAFWFAARDGAADLLKGMRGAEELADYPDEKEVTGSATFVEQPKRIDQPAAAKEVKTSSGVTVPEPASAAAPSSAPVVESQRPDPVSSTGSAGAEVRPTTATGSTRPTSPDSNMSDTTSDGTGQGKDQPTANAENATPSTNGTEREPGSDDEPEVVERKVAEAQLVDDGGPRLTPQQITILNRRLEGAALSLVDFRAKFGKERFEQMPASAFNAIASWIRAPF